MACTRNRFAVQSTWMNRALACANQTITIMTLKRKVEPLGSSAEPGKNAMIAGAIAKIRPKITVAAAITITSSDTSSDVIAALSPRPA